MASLAHMVAPHTRALLTALLAATPLSALADSLSSAAVPPTFGNYRACIPFLPGTTKLAPTGNAALRLLQSIEPPPAVVESMWLRIRSTSDKDGTLDWGRVVIARESVLRARPFIAETYQEVSLLTGPSSSPFPCQRDNVYVDLSITPPVFVPLPAADHGQLTCTQCSIVCEGTECNFRP